MRLLRGGPLKAQTVAIGIVKPQLLHPVRSDFRLFRIHTIYSQMLVSRVQIFATKKQAGIIMGRDPCRIWRSRALVGFVRSIEHQLPPIQLEPSPIAIVPGLGRSVNRESENVAIETDGGGHIENLNQRTNSVDVHGRTLLLGRTIYQKTEWQKTETPIEEPSANSRMGPLDPRAVSQGRSSLNCEKLLSVPKTLLVNVDSIRAYCMSFPEATEKLQWGDALCFKIKGKMFAVLGLDRVRLTFKCTPERFAELIERQDIRPSPYLGRHNWVMVERLDALRHDELRDLIRQSYEMAGAKAPKRKVRPAKQKKKKTKKRAVTPKTRKKRKQD